MSSHSFKFNGGEILSKMGASWFVSYAYFEKIDKTHKNWNKIPTVQTRISKYNNSRNYHKDWLKEILFMNLANLNKNTIALKAEDIIAMAKRLLAN